jgi:DNA-binding NtrC family response regulator
MARILVIDDEPQMRTMLRQMLERAGYDIVAAPDGKKAMELFRRQTPDLVITDMLMPEKDGIETIIEMKGESTRVKIIAVSGGGHIGPDDYLYMAKKLGVVRTFSKPIAMEALLAAVREALD